MPLDQLAAEIPQLELGGTLGVHLALHAMRRGYGARILTYNLSVFDPTWFTPGVDLAAKLEAQRRVKQDARVRESTKSYLEFLALGGRIEFEELNATLLRRYLAAGTPILTGLSATYLYQNEREDPHTDESDDVGGYPVGHFVILCGYEKPHSGGGRVVIADPYTPNPITSDPSYRVSLSRVVASILLGILTYDANLVILEPPENRS